MTAEQQQPGNAEYAVIIVGSTGLIGSKLVARFAGDYQVFAMDIKEPEDKLPPGCEFIKIDVTSRERVQEAFTEARRKARGAIASVIQLAAYYDFSGEPSKLYDKITVQGARRVLQTARDNGAEQFVFSSTMLVHRATEPGASIDEHQPLNAKWAYPESKIAAEGAIQAEHGDLPAVLLRIAGVYSDACDSLPLSHQIQRIYERRMTATVYPGDTACGQAFVHIDDLVEAFWQTVQRRHELGPGVLPILIGEPQTPGYGDLQQAIADRLHGEPGWTTREIPKLVAKSGAWVQDSIPGVEDPFIKPWMIDSADDHYELNISRAHAKLGWSPHHRIMDSLDRMIAALQSDPEGWYAHHNLEVPATVEQGSGS